MNRYNIRQANINDLDGIKKLLMQINNLHANIRPDIFIYDKMKYSDQELINLINDNNRITFVCVDENDMVLGHAFCIFKEIIKTNNTKERKELYIDDLCVLDEFQGQGIGSKLCDFIFDYGNKNGFDYITLNVWSGNESAISFYENKGFSIRNIHMEKRIGDLNEEN